PMIINHVVAGQEEGNARLILETNSGVIALSPAAVVARLQRVFADNAKEWREWAANIAKLSRPRAALDIAEFLLSLDSPNYHRGFSAVKQERNERGTVATV